MGRLGKLAAQDFRVVNPLTALLRNVKLAGPNDVVQPDENAGINMSATASKPVDMLGAWEDIQANLNGADPENRDNTEVRDELDDAARAQQEAAAAVKTDAQQAKGNPYDARREGSTLPAPNFRGPQAGETFAERRARVQGRELSAGAKKRIADRRAREQKRSDRLAHREWQRQNSQKQDAAQKADDQAYRQRQMKSYIDRVAGGTAKVTPGMARRIQQTYTQAGVPMPPEVSSAIEQPMRDYAESLRDKTNPYYSGFERANAYEASQGRATALPGLPNVEQINKNVPSPAANPAQQQPLNQQPVTPPQLPDGNNGGQMVATAPNPRAPVSPPPSATPNANAGYDGAIAAKTPAAAKPSAPKGETIGVNT